MFATGESRLNWVYRVLLLAVIGTLILASKVWITDRNFPLVPLFGWIPSIPSPLDKIIYYVLVVLCIYQVVSLENLKTRKILTGIYISLLLLDQMRWQPYNVHYMLMLIGFLYYPARSEELLNVFRFMLITFFIWTGIQDFNQVFADKVYPQVWSKNLAEKFPYSMEGYITGSGYLFALLHILAGIGLLIQRFRKISMFLGIFIHLFLFYGADPFGSNVNLVAPLYNLISAVFCFILFYDASFDFKALFWSKKFRYQQVCVIFFAGLPILSFLGIYDRMQSFNMYSGKGWYAKIYVTEALVEKLPEGMKRYVDRPFGSEPYIETTYWAWKELKVSPYNEKRVYVRLQEYICSFAEGDCQSRIEFYTY
jgi:hypothetical protein